MNGTRCGRLVHTTAACTQDRPGVLVNGEGRHHWEAVAPIQVFTALYAACGVLLHLVSMGGIALVD